MDQMIAEFLGAPEATGPLDIYVLFWLGCSALLGTAYVVYRRSPGHGLSETLVCIGMLGLGLGWALLRAQGVGLSQGLLGLTILGFVLPIAWARLFSQG